MSEKAMAHYPNLWRRGTRYYLRKRVPSDLVAALGKKTHVVVSLRTGDRRIAERKYGVELGNVERRFVRLRADQQQAQRLQGQLTAGKLQMLAGAGLDAMVHDWFREAVQPVSLEPPDDWREHRIDIQATTAALESDDPEQWRDHVEHVVDQILLRAGAPRQVDRRRIKPRVGVPAIDKASLQYQHLCRLVRRALLVGTRRDLADVTGRPMADDDPLFSIASTKPVARPTGMTLDDLIRAFENDPGRAGQSTKTGIEYSMVFRAMRESIFAYRMDWYIARQAFTGTGNLAARRDVMLRVGPFRGIEVAEDRDWGQRASALGYALRYEAGLVVFHPARCSFRELAQKWDRHIAHDLALMQTRDNWRLRWLLRALAVAASPVLASKEVFSSDRVCGVRERWRALICLVRIRSYRAGRMLQILGGVAGSNFLASWNRS